jgi:hypothetical protein
MLKLSCRYAIYLITKGYDSNRDTYTSNFVNLLKKSRLFHQCYEIFRFPRFNGLDSISRPGTYSIFKLLDDEESGMSRSHVVGASSIFSLVQEAVHTPLDINVSNTLDDIKDIIGILMYTNYYFKNGNICFLDKNPHVLFVYDPPDILKTSDDKTVAIDGTDSINIYLLDNSSIQEIDSNTSANTILAKFPGKRIEDYITKHDTSTQHFTVK